MSKISNFDKFFDQYGAPYSRCEDMEEYMRVLSEQNEIHVTEGDIYFAELENQIAQKYDSLFNHQETLSKINKIITDYHEEAEVLKTIKPSIPDNFNLYHEASDAFGNEAISVRFRYICGTIGADKVTRFERTVFRVSRGKAFLSNFPMKVEDQKLLEKGDAENNT